MKYGGAPNFSFTEGWWPIEHAANYLNMTRDQVLDLIRKGRVDAQVMGDSFLVHGLSIMHHRDFNRHIDGRAA